jgi:hypothetical protein
MEFFYVNKIMTYEKKFVSFYFRFILVGMRIDFCYERFVTRFGN